MEESENLSAPIEFIKAVLKHWGILVTSGAGIGALEIWQATGHYVPHWIFWSVAAIGLVVASYQAWQDEHQHLAALKRSLKGFQQEDKKEMIRIITMLHAMESNVLNWRDITKDKSGRASATVRLLPDDWSSVVYQAGKISSLLREQVEVVEKTLTEANSTITEFLGWQVNYRDPRLMSKAYRLLDEAVPRLAAVIAEFEAHERSLG